eukprot:9254851-Lingulodinium_polyedra.AAC.1
MHQGAQFADISRVLSSLDNRVRRMRVMDPEEAKTLGIGSSRRSVESFIVPAANAVFMCNASG